MRLSETILALPLVTACQPGSVSLESGRGTELSPYTPDTAAPADTDSGTAYDTVDTSSVDSADSGEDTAGSVLGQVQTTTLECEGLLQKVNRPPATNEYVARDNNAGDPTLNGAAVTDHFLATLNPHESGADFMALFTCGTFTPKGASESTVVGATTVQDLKTHKITVTTNDLSLATGSLTLWIGTQTGEGAQIIAYTRPSSEDVVARNYTVFQDGGVYTVSDFR